jgi:hypothetical protein
MNRLTIQPEFNVKFADELKLFLSWRFVKEPRYSMESESREQSVQPAGKGHPLPSTFYDEYSPVPWGSCFGLQTVRQVDFQVGKAIHFMG